MTEEMMMAGDVLVWLFTILQSMHNAIIPVSH